MDDNQRAMIELLSAVCDLAVVTNGLLRRQQFIDPEMDERMKAVNKACDEAYLAIYGNYPLVRRC